MHCILKRKRRRMTTGGGMFEISSEVEQIWYPTYYSKRLLVVICTLNSSRTARGLRVRICRETYCKWLRFLWAVLLFFRDVLQAVAGDDLFIYWYFQKRTASGCGLWSVYCLFYLETYCKRLRVMIWFVIFFRDVLQAVAGHLSGAH